VYVSEHWEIDLGRRELRSHGAPIPIGGRAFEIVEVLAAAAGELVTKDELMQRVWRGTIVGENTLQVYISAIRKALGPDRNMLKTASGRGYRLLGSWRQTTVPEDMAAASPTPQPAQPSSTNLPVATSDLIGRDAAVEHLRNALSAYRVVTLTGPGGIGKTALALDAARGIFSTDQGDVWMVELASLTDPGLVATAVAGALELKLDDGKISPDSVARAIGRRKLLLVLDNCEHLIDSAARFAETLVRLCPRATVLATSREVLRIDGEYVYRVSALDVPDLRQDEPDHVLGHSAVQLFIARAQAFASSFSPYGENLATIAGICRHLDGIPLAIEFAAARTATLGLPQVAARLKDRFELLTGGRRTALPRHQTLRATLDWSFELLSEDERRLLRRLAVFAGGFTFEAAAAVVSDPSVSSAAVVEAISDLAAKSLVVLDQSRTGSRWRLLETTRAYALEKLAESREVELAARRQAVFLRDLFTPAAPMSQSPPTSERMAHYGVEIDNVRTALDWAFSSDGDTMLGTTLTAAYVPVWIHLSLMVECRERSERALQSLQQDSSLSARDKMQLHIALAVAMLHSTGIADSTGIVLASALEVAEGLDDADSQLRALWASWSFSFNRGENGIARSHADQFARIAERTGELSDVLVGDRLVGSSLHYGGDQVEARRRLERMVERYVPPSDQRHMMWFHHDQRLLARAMLARVHCLQGRIDQATLNAQLSLDEALAADHKLGICYALGEAVCPIMIMTGEFESAEKSIAMLIDIVTQHSVTLWKSLGPCMEAELLIKRGEFAAGAALLQRTLQTFAGTGYKMRNPHFRCVLAEGLGGAGRFTEALAILDEALVSSQRDDQRWCLAELHRVKGELLLQRSDGDVISTAEDCLVAALEVARRQGSLLYELRAALSLARLRITQKRQTHALTVLAPVYDRFTEGLETADLRAAGALLEALVPYRRGAES